MSEWISVDDDRKPPLMEGEDAISVPVLLYVPRWARQVPDTGIRLGCFLHYSRKFRPDGSMGCENDVTHWMPLPEPPSPSHKESNDE